MSNTWLEYAFRSSGLFSPRAISTCHSRYAVLTRSGQVFFSVCNSAFSLIVPHSAQSIWLLLLSYPLSCILSFFCTFSLFRCASFTPAKHYGENRNIVQADSRLQSAVSPYGFHWRDLYRLRVVTAQPRYWNKLSSLARCFRETIFVLIISLSEPFADIVPTYSVIFLSE